VLLALLTNPSELFILNVVAHGAMESPAELAIRAEYVSNARRSLAKCAHQLQTRERLEQRLHRRAELVDKFVEMKKRDGVEINLNPALHKRDLSDKVKVDSLFSSNPKCVLAPEVTFGPYYASGQFIRDDMREDVPGVELLLALEVIDVNTCKPLPKVMFDIWHCSNVGKYSAFTQEGTAGETFLRGLQPTGDDGILTMTTIFPGWYEGRTIHVHIAAHINGTISSNGDFYSGGSNAHIGQLFFSEDILSQIHNNSKYSDNKNGRKYNDKDSIYTQAKNSQTELNPEMDIHFVEKGNINAGLVGTMVLAIDTSKNYALEVGQGATTASGNKAGNGDGTAESSTAPPSASNSSAASFLTISALFLSSVFAAALGLCMFNW